MTTPTEEPDDLPIGGALTPQPEEAEGSATTASPEPVTPPPPVTPPSGAAAPYPPPPPSATTSVSGPYPPPPPSPGSSSAGTYPPPPPGGSTPPDSYPPPPSAFPPPPPSYQPSSGVPPYPQPPATASQAGGYAGQGGSYPPPPVGSPGPAPAYGAFPPGPGGGYGMTGLKAHRGGLVLAIGLLSVLFCGPLGIAAWLMGRADLAEMDAGLMDPTGRGMTNVGRILGIVGVALTVISLFFVLPRVF